MRAVQLRFNALPCGDNAARHLRGQQSGAEHSPEGTSDQMQFTARCRYKCLAQETVSHITQHCHYDGKSMINVRHNRLVGDLSRHLIELGHHVIAEHSFLTEEGTVRPDILVRTHDDSKAYILDVSCPFNAGTFTLSQTEYWKKNKYNKPDLLRQVRTVLRTSDSTEVEVCGVIFGARGNIAQRSYMVLRALGVTKRKISLWSELTIFRTVDIWCHFMRGDYWNRLSNRRLGRWRASGRRNAAPPRLAGPTVQSFSN